MSEAASVPAAAPESPAAGLERLVHIAGLAKTFFSTDQHFTALDGVDLDLASDDFFCLLGPSGCGKTTVLNILAGFEEPTDGTVEFEGGRVAGPSRDRGVVFQADNSLYEWLTARQNVEFGLRIGGAGAEERDRTAGEFLELVGLGDQGHKYPHELSGGMRQRVQLARVLANRPRMLVMDEPFAALDAQNRRVLQEELRRIWHEHKVTVLFITHDIEEALLLGTRIGVMTAGPNAGIKEIIEIPPEMKRDRVDHGFVEMYARVQDLIADETNKSLAAQAGRAKEESKPLGRTSLAARERHRRARQSRGAQSLGIYAMFHPHICTSSLTSAHPHPHTGELSGLRCWCGGSQGLEGRGGRGEGGSRRQDYLCEWHHHRGQELSRGGEVGRGRGEGGEREGGGGGEREREREWWGEGDPILCF